MNCTMSFLLFLIKIISSFCIVCFYSNYSEFSSLILLLWVKKFTNLIIYKIEM